MSWLQEALGWVEIFPFLDFMDDPKGEEKYEKIKIKANKLLEFLYDNDVPQPFGFKDQWIQIEWETKSRYFEISIRENGYSMLYQDESNEIEKNENDFNILLKYVKKVYENNSI